MPGRVAVWAVLALLACGGCKRSTERTMERHAREAMSADEVEVSEDGGRMRIAKRSDAGSSEIEIGSAALIPADFPKSIPIYPGSKLVASVGSTDDEKRSHMLTLLAPAAANDVHAFYEARLAALGKVSDFSLGGVHILRVRGDGGAGVSVTITSSGPNESTLQLSTTPG